jgi:hypothetical protein
MENAIRTKPCTTQHPVASAFAIQKIADRKTNGKIQTLVNANVLFLILKTAEACACPNVREVKQETQTVASVSAQL